LSNNLALVVNAEGETVAHNSEVRKRRGSAVFPQYGSIAIDFRIINIQTGRYVKWKEAQIA
jgi:hypothetical protein